MSVPDHRYPFETGDEAPDFSLQTDAHGAFSLSGCRGKPVALFFYSQDDTQTCTNETLDFERLRPEFEKAGVVLVGISPDSLESHAKFRKKYKLKLMLASDPDHVSISAYGLWGPKKMAGREYMGLIRSSFLIDADGKIAQIWKVLRTKGHAEAVLEAASALG